MQTYNWRGAGCLRWLPQAILIGNISGTQFPGVKKKKKVLHGNLSQVKKAFFQTFLSTPEEN